MRQNLAFAFLYNALGVPVAAGLLYPVFGVLLSPMIAAAATIAVVYPHMNGLGGDNFWLIHSPDEPPLALDACGPAAAQASAAFYRQHGQDAIPARGPLAALTVAGAVAGWQQAHQLSTRWGGRLPLSRLLEDALHYARHGAPVTLSQQHNTLAKQQEMGAAPGFAELYLEGQWVRATPAFDARLCAKFHVEPLEFDGVNDSLFQEYDKNGRRFMDYIRYHGVFADLPWDYIFDSLREIYPHIFEQGMIDGDLLQEASQAAPVKGHAADAD